MQFSSFSVLSRSRLFFSLRNKKAATWQVQAMPASTVNTQKRVSWKGPLPMLCTKSPPTSKRACSNTHIHTFPVRKKTAESITPIKKLYPTCRTVAPKEAPPNKFKMCQPPNSALLTRTEKSSPRFGKLSKSRGRINARKANSSMSPMDRHFKRKSHNKSMRSIFASPERSAEKGKLATHTKRQGKHQKIACKKRSLRPVNDFFSPASKMSGTKKSALAKRETVSCNMPSARSSGKIRKIVPSNKIKATQTSTNDAAMKISFRYFFTALSYSLDYTPPAKKFQALFPFFHENNTKFLLKRIDKRGKRDYNG